MRADAARVIDNVAASVADGVRVDWDKAGAQVSGREERLIRHLRLIDSVATVYRTLPAVHDESASVAAPPDDPDGPRWGRLILLDRIGSGTSADVFRVWDAELQREVALKLLHDDGGSDAAANARLLQEARRLARIKHPHVVNVYGAERHESRIGLWMELVRGRSLEEMVRQEGPFAIAEAAHIGIDLCSALAAVHAAGLLHRDVKAQNVVRDETGWTVLMDFGTGEELSHGKPRLAGTPLYLAPEVIAGQPATVQTDVYGVGVLLFYLVAGQFPVQGESLDGIADAHRSGRLRALQDVRPDAPDAFARVVDRALAPEPARRFASASAMETALRQVVERNPPMPTGTRRHLWTLVLSAAATIALVGTLWGTRARPVATADANAVAVLPLRFVSGQSEAPYLAEALTDQIITTLGQVQSLKVTAHTSVAQFGNTTLPVADIAKQLGVGSVVEGSVAVQHVTGKDTPSVRVNMRLIRAGTDVEIWSSTFDRPLGDMFALESDIARAIARQVRAALGPEERARLAQGHPTSPAAERAYLEGRALLHDYGTEHAAAALQAFRTALDNDPNHAPAHAGAARAYMALGFDGIMTQPAARVSAVADTTRALELDDGLAEAHVALADLKFYYDWDWAGAEQEYRKASQLNPNLVYALTQYARFLAAAGRSQEALTVAADASTRDPLSPDAAQTRGLIQYYARDYDGAAVTLAQALAQNPSHARIHFTLARVYDAQGRYAEALSETERAMALAAGAGGAWQAEAIRLRALNGDRTGAQEAYRLFERRLVAGGATPGHEWAGYVHAALGQPERALDDLAACIAERDPSVLWLRVDARFDTLRSIPRFAELVKRVGPS